MVTIYDADPAKVIPAIAEELKKIDAVKPPAWAPFVKTGVFKERRPEGAWWYVRCASILRYIYLNGPVGVRKLQDVYGGKKDRGSKPESRRRGSGSIIRKSLQQLEEATLIKKAERSKRPLGRAVAPAGRKLLDSVSSRIK